MKNKIKKVKLDIKNLKIQGATNIVLAIISLLQFFLKKASPKNIQQLRKNFFKLTKDLVNIRPTEPYAQNLYFF